MVANDQHKQNTFIPLSEAVTACTAHPLHGAIIAGTKVCMIKMINYLTIINIFVCFVFYLSTFCVKFFSFLCLSIINVFLSILHLLINVLRYILFFSLPVGV